MSFQAYLDAAEDKTVHSPQELVDLATERGFGADTRSGEILDWLKTEFDLGRGHSMALVHVIKNGPGISEHWWHPPRPVDRTPARREARP